MDFKKIFSITNKFDIMKTTHFLTLILLTVCLSSCEVIGTIFEAGVWTGVLGIALVLVLIGFILVKAFKK